MKWIVLIIVLLTCINLASAQVEVTKSNDNLYLTLIAVILTILLTMRGTLKLLIMNPVMILLLCVGLILMYIFFSAMMIAFGIGDWIDSSIQNIVNILTSIRGN